MLSSAASSSVDLLSYLASDPARSALRQVYLKNPRNVFSVVTTGGGGTLAGWILSTPGGSNSLVSFDIPYARSALHNYMGKTGSAGCNIQTSIDMSKVAYRKTVERLICEDNDLTSFVNCNIFGLSCTAALVSDVVKKGHHRVHCSAYRNDHTVKSVTATLLKGARNRLSEEEFCSTLMLRSILENSNLSQDLIPFELFSESAVKGDELETTIQSNSESVLQRLYRGTISHVMFVPKHSAIPETSIGAESMVFVEEINFPDNCIVYCGSFNPLHEGHIELALAALKLNGWNPDDFMNRKNPPIIFEITPFNADKAWIEESEVIRRIEQFDPLRNELFRRHGITNVGVCVSSKSLFVSKSEIFRNCTFLVGSDTFIRLIDPKFYGPKDLEPSDQVAQIRLNYMIAALAKIQSYGCSFVVGGRLMNGKFESLSSIWAASAIANTLPLEVREMFKEIPERDFRRDISSTDIRNRSH